MNFLAFSGILASFFSLRRSFCFPSLEHFHAFFKYIDIDVGTESLFLLNSLRQERKIISHHINNSQQEHKSKTYYKISLVRRSYLERLL